MSDTDTITNEDTEEEIEKDQYLIFTIKSQQFGFQAMRIQEISTIMNMTNVPNAPLYIKGIMNLRGKLASIISFRKRFGLEDKPNDEDTRIIIVERMGHPIGIIVDSVEEVLKIPDDKVQRIPESLNTASSSEYVMGIAILGEKRIVTLLNLDTILTKYEVTMMEHEQQIETDSIKPSKYYSQIVTPIMSSDIIR